MVVEAVPGARAQSDDLGPRDMDFELSFAGSTLWSGAEDVAIQGDTGFYAFWNGLLIIDWSVEPFGDEIGCLDLEGRPRVLCVEGDLAFALRTGLSVIDVSDPAHPFLRSSLPDLIANTSYHFAFIIQAFYVVGLA